MVLSCAQESKSDSLIALSMEANGSELANTYYELVRAIVGHTSRQCTLFCKSG